MTRLTDKQIADALMHAQRGDLFEGAPLVKVFEELAERRADPIAEIEKLRGLILIHDDPVDGDSLHWLTDTGGQERIGYSGISVGDIRAAAARLLDRIKAGAK